MSDLGRQLRDARLARGLSLDDVQEMTKIRKRYLEAIEAGDFKVLPGSFYVRAFIKTYAEAVGISPDELLQEHQDLVPEPETAEPVMEPVVQPRRAARRNAATASRSGKLLSTILMWTFPILIIVLVWVFVIKQNAAPQIAENKPTGQQQQQGNTGGGTTTPPSSTNTTPESSGGGTTSQPTGGGTPSTGESTEGTTNGEATGTTEGTPEGTPEGTTEGGTTTDASSTPVVTESGKQGRNTIFDVNYTGADTVKVNIQATGQSWLEVYKSDNSSGERLFFNNTESGQSLSYDLTDSGLYIKSGNSRATNITINGQPITDGKATSRIVLKLVKEAPSTDTTTGTDTTTDGTTTDSNSDSTSTDSESTSSGN
ncbi:helix-turn-helix domain-containing protein [Paenibacillus wenxiniae]|uniref:Helix-turn-helix domain-containing protein n=1 Tax=Paenibacillus wenxiniae TaxID=1636843 RepID=A0ABW4RRQ0_9BACL